MRTVDVVIHENCGRFRAGPEELKAEPPVSLPFVLANDLSIELFDQEVANRILDMGDPEPFGIPKPVRQFAQFYSFTRAVSVPSATYVWDEDSRLQTCVALSRLVHPTTLSLRYAGRVRYGASDKLQDIFLADIRGVGIDPYLADPEARDWLTDSEAETLRIILAALDSRKLPSRVSRAFWLHEYACRTYYVEVRWSLIATGLEALVHTDRHPSTRQFTKRVSKMAAQIGVADFSEPDAENAYDIRSKLAHGEGLKSLSEADRSLYGRMENTLRKCLLRASLDSSYCDTFLSDDEIRKRWPI